MKRLNRLWCVLAWLLVAVAAWGQSVFDMPRLFPQHKRTLSQFVEALGRGDLLAAESAARAGVKLFPQDANWHYNVACVCARAGRTEEALDWLKKAVERGFVDIKQLEGDTDLCAVRGLPGYKAVLAQAREAAKVGAQNATLSRALVTQVPVGAEAEVNERNTQWEWDPRSGGYMTTLLQLLPPKGAVDRADYAGPLAEVVRPMLSAEGCAGLLYVNRDEDLCAVRYEAFPGLTPVLYGEAAQHAKAHKGLANGIFSTGLSAVPVVGNASVMMGNSIFWRSIPRGISSDAAAMGLAYRLAAANQLYVYDATVDYSPAFQGDLLYARNPAIIASADLASAEKPDAKGAQRDLTELILAAVAVMTPEAKREMLQRGALVATMQRLLREHVRGSEGYLTASAHPAVFDPQQIDGEALLRAAHALTPEALPPALALAVRQETMPVQFVDYFDLVGGERIADTPTCITRIVRGRALTRRLTVEAASPERGMTYRWFVVQGDAAKVRLRPLTSSGAMCTIEVDYQAPAEVAGRLSRRVEVACVGVRADGVMSAPAFVAFRTLGNERRSYDAQGRLEAIDYRAPESGYIYEDPLLTAFKNWRDTYHYSESGRCEGWTRLSASGQAQDFDAQGRRIVAPGQVQKVSYVPRMNQGADGVHAPALELMQMDATK